MLNKNRLHAYIEQLNLQDTDESDASRYISDATCADWLLANIPLFDCPDELLTETYYFRYWTFRKHIRKTAEGFVITEFLPDVPWSGPYNTISCPVGHQFAEGRWIKDRRILSDYARFYLTGSGKGNHLLSYSNWFCTALYRFCLVSGDFSVATEHLDELIAYYEERCRRNASGDLYWSDDDRDGMEFSISGDGLRPTINSYLCGDAFALSRFCAIAGQEELARRYEKKHAHLKKEMKRRLWDSELCFYVNRSAPAPHADPDEKIPPIREQCGYTPWYFDAADEGTSSAWQFLADQAHFSAPYGIMTADRSDPRFMKTDSDHPCLWDGPVWPFATSITLTALSAYLRSDTGRGGNGYITKNDFYALLSQFAASQFLDRNGKRIRWIDENLHPMTGEWLTRSLLKSKYQASGERGMAYNHSTFGDLILSGLLGISATEDGRLIFDPITPPEWEYFAAEQVPLLGHTVDIYWDKYGSVYGHHKGLTVMADGNTAAHADELNKIEIQLRKETKND